MERSWELLNFAFKNFSFYSKGGAVYFSGGDLFYQDQLIRLLRSFKATLACVLLDMHTYVCHIIDPALRSSVIKHM